jgi:hypothetical protein
VIVTYAAVVIAILPVIRELLTMFFLFFVTFESAERTLGSVLGHLRVNIWIVLSA